ncbi:FecR family protein [Enterobacterales bacterium AE_CKDN230030158-1A_HGKHYDSX7]
MSSQVKIMTDDDRFAEASAWHYRLQADDASREDEAAFDAWLSGDEANAKAWTEAQALLMALQGPARRARLKSTSRRPQRAWRWATAAAVLLASGLLWTTPWPDRMRADHYTSVGETRRFELADGSQVELDTDAAISVQLAAGERRVKLLRGGAWFDVTHDASRPFVVESNNTRVRVLGTQFGVAQQDGVIRIRLSRGRIAASIGDSGVPVILSPGQEVDVTADQLSTTQPFYPAVAFAWRQRQLVFRQQPLSEVVAELDRYWPGKLLLTDNALGRRKVSGVFEIDKPEAVLRALHLTMGVRVERYTPYLTLLRAPMPSKG